jgi:hypothetical protein
MTRERDIGLSAGVAFAFAVGFITQAANSLDLWAMSVYLIGGAVFALFGLHIITQEPK